MIDEFVAADTAAMKGQQMPVKYSDNGHKIAGVLNLVGVSCCRSLNFIRPVGHRSSCTRRHVVLRVKGFLLTTNG